MAEVNCNGRKKLTDLPRNISSQSYSLLGSPLLHTKFFDPVQSRAGVRTHE